jgi:hypothetical protein
MVDFISVGTDNFEDYDVAVMVEGLGDKAMQVVYSYESAPYEGMGFAAIKYEDGYDLTDIGHCSCNGPDEKVVRSEGGMRETFAEVLESWAYADKDAQFLAVVEKCKALGWV